MVTVVFDIGLLITLLFNVLLLFHWKLPVPEAESCAVCPEQIVGAGPADASGDCKMVTGF